MREDVSGRAVLQMKKLSCGENSDIEIINNDKDLF